MGRLLWVKTEVVFFILSTHSVKRYTQSGLKINPLAGWFIFCGLNSIRTNFRTVQTHRVELDRVEPWVKPTLVLCLNDLRMVYIYLTFLLDSYE